MGESIVQHIILSKHPSKTDNDTSYKMSSVDTDTFVYKTYFLEKYWLKMYVDTQKVSNSMFLNDHII